jgi:hypothetical protein
VASPKWLPFDGLVQIVLARFRISVGAAEGTVRKALASGDIRRLPEPVLLVYDDGMMDMNLRPGAVNKGGVELPDVHYPGRYSVDDFLYWLRLNPLQTERVTRQAEPATKPRKQPKRDIIKGALKALFPPDGKPDPMPFHALRKRLEKKLGYVPSRDTLLRVLGRRK